MKFYLKAAVFALLLNVAGWYASEAMLWLEFTLKPYTHVGMVVATWGHHILIAILATVGGVMLASLATE